MTPRAQINPPHRLTALLSTLLIGSASLCVWSATFAQPAPLSSSSAVSERVLFDEDWRFQRGDQEGESAHLTYQELRPWILPTGAGLLNSMAPPPLRPTGEPALVPTYAVANYNDQAWRKVDLPHDWGIEGPFDQALPGETGKLPWAGTGWYRKSFISPAEDSEKRVGLDVDGAMAYSAIWLNGKFVGGWPYGYASFRVDLTPFLAVGQRNVLAIRLNNLPDSSRWYPGGGLYRHVWLVKTPPIHVSHWGVTVTTPHIANDQALVVVSVLTKNETGEKAPFKVEHAVYELTGDNARGLSPVATVEAVSVELPAHREGSTSQTLVIPHPKRWSLVLPQRYVAVTTLTREGKPIETVETLFGIRTAVFDAEKGFLLNGEVLPLRGVCLHHDLGALGAAVNIHGLERQIALLQEMGCNAIRTSHNPPSPELLEVCDHRGMLVLDEAFDCWAIEKKPNDYHLLFAEWHEQDLRALVRRDRNHPCVVLWSIGNEVSEQWRENAYSAWNLAAHLSGIVHEEDSTRPTTSAYVAVEAGYNGLQNAVDVMGFNYKPWDYARFRRLNQAKPLVGSETASTISSRGEYFFPMSDKKSEGAVNFQVSSYDLSVPEWATTPAEEFASQERVGGVAGEFVWTGFDYLGEPTPYSADTTNLLNFADPVAKERAAEQLRQLGKVRVPSRSSYFGILDLAGFKKDRFYLYQAHWRPDLPMAHLLPHWTWPERVGEVTPVHVYTSGDEAELFLNGKSLGRRKKEPFQYRLRWDDVRYAPGELKVIAYLNGRHWAEDTLHTAGVPSHLVVSPDRVRASSGGQDLIYITARVEDTKGSLVPKAHPTLKFTIEGAADVVAVDNGDATSFESFQGSTRNAYNGLCLAIVRVRAGASGTVAVTAQSEGLTPGSCQFTIGP